MSSLAETGGTLSITSYNLDMWDGVAWVELTGVSSDFVLATFTKSSLTTGTDYLFRVRAKNIHGFGEYSDQVTIRADEVPA